MAGPTRRRGEGELELTRRTLGNAMVVHRPGVLSGHAQNLALAVAEDPEHDLVLVDLPPGMPVTVWDSVAGVLPRGRRGVRLVISGRTREAAALAGQLLSERLGRPVIAPDGAVIPGDGGSLFVDAGRGTSWVRFERGRSPRSAGKRFPVPQWESVATSELVPTSSRGVAEPVPGGMWVRVTGSERQQQAHRTRLVATVPVRPDALTIVLGSPGDPPVSLDDVARLWVRLPDTVQARTRFVRFGPVSVPAGKDVGQALAELLGQEITFYTGMPVGTGAAAYTVTVLPDGAPGWLPFVYEERYSPSGGIPGAVTYRAPVAGLPEVAPATYWYAPDAVVEVVRSGLVVRPPGETADTAAARAAAFDPAVLAVTFEGAGAVGERMRGLARDLVDRLDPASRRTARLSPSSVLNGERVHAPAAGAALAQLSDADADAVAETTAGKPAVPVLAVEPATVRAPFPVVTESRVTESAVPGPASITETLEPHAVTPVVAEPSVPPATPAAPEPVSPPAPKPSQSPLQVTLQQTPRAEASALLPSRGVEEEREWLRKSLGAEYGVLSNSVARVLTQHPGFQGEMSRSSADVLTDAVAVRIYLSERGAAIDEGLRGGGVGAHVPVARCVVAGLSRLPSHRGPATFAVSPSPAHWALYRSRRVVTEWGFLGALTGPAADLPGQTDVWVWSMTARRTRLLETGEITDRVLFVPGTSFKVLELSEPDGTARGRIMLREVTASEVGESGRLVEGAEELDELALSSLRREVGKWAEKAAPRRVGGEDAARFGTLPGLAVEKGER
ncbi:hypothetical protein [Amycolatopsis sp. NPDC059021]|uniref:hypothetical protein n=1 Tax=Amycolatopsis sp. NPDC059021 TaxID=3346704 RepID=UPI00366E3745